MRLGVLLFVIACASLFRDGEGQQQECRVVRMATATAADSAAAMVACLVTAQRFTLLTGLPAPSGTILVGKVDTPAMFGAHGSWTLRWPSEAQYLRVAAQLGYSGEQARSHASDADQSVLPHEIGHAQSYARWGDAANKVPPWYNEAAAMWMEPIDLQRHRLQQAQDARGTAPPLDSVLRFKHPKIDPTHTTFSRTELIGPCRGVCGAGRTWKTRLIVWRVRDDGTSTADTLYDEAAAASIVHGDSVSRYYNYSLAMLYYVRVRGVAAALHAVAARIGPDSADVDPLAGLVGLPPSGALREADWQHWLRSASATLR